MEYWKKLSFKEQDALITDALADNIDYDNSVCLGVPASRLDPEVFYKQAPFLKESPLLRTYVQNPNHIGCHTLGESEPFFKGTQRIERDVVELLSVDLFGAEKNSCDGYVASGGTEANIQATWIYRNYFVRTFGASTGEIAIICSVDTHYSVAKAANLLNTGLYYVPVNEETRMIEPRHLDEKIAEATANGVRYFIAFCNMGTTMFGSIDDPDVYATAFEKHNVHYKLHVDGAFGGFIYPISNAGSNLCFTNPAINSITLDAHKMLQAPYGTGIFLVKKDWMQYTVTKEASYVSGMDMTLIGSRGGVNAVAIWMILATYGPYGWLEKINRLLFRTDWLCQKLSNLNVQYYRHPYMNIVTIKAPFVPQWLVEKYGLIPDNHEDAHWYKIVMMDHVSIDDLENFTADIKGHLYGGCCMAPVTMASAV